MEQQRTVNIIQYHVTTPQSIIVTWLLQYQKYNNTYVCTLIPWQCCKSIAFAEDVRSINTEVTSLKKIFKYTGVRQSLDFVAIAIETLGPINADGVSFLTDLGGRLTTTSAIRAIPASSCKGFPSLCKDSISLLSMAASRRGWKSPTEPQYGYKGLLGYNVWISRWSVPGVKNKMIK